MNKIASCLVLRRQCQRTDARGDRSCRVEMMTINRLFSGAAGLAASLFAGQADAGVGKDIRDWSINCTSGLTCSISFINVNWDAKGINQLSFLRTDDPNAEVDLQISTPPGFDEKGDAKGVYSF